MSQLGSFSRPSSLSVWFLLAAALFAVGALTALLSAPPEGVIVLRAARMFDGISGNLTQPGVLIVEGNRILAAGASAAAPANARIIDLGDATLLPGFIDAHVHITMQRGADAREDRLNSLSRTIPEMTLEAAVYARRTLEAGFTTIRNLGAADFIDIGLRNAIRRGLTPGPRIVAATRSIGSLGGHCDSTNSYRAGLFGPEPGWEKGIIAGEEQARAAVRYNVKHGADVIKICATGGVLSANEDVDSPQLTQQELHALVDEAHAKGKKIAAHAHGDEGARRAVLAGIDSIEHGSFLSPETLALMKEKGTVLIPTLLAPHALMQSLEAGAIMDARNVTKTKIAHDRIFETCRRAIQMGVRVGFGTDAGVFEHGRNAEEFLLLVKVGMRPADALLAATARNASLLGWADRLGTLEAGKLADIIAVPGDPLRDISLTGKVFFVMKDGVIHRHAPRS